MRVAIIWLVAVRIKKYSWTPLSEWMKDEIYICYSEYMAFSFSREWFGGFHKKAWLVCEFGDHLKHAHHGYGGQAGYPWAWW